MYRHRTLLPSISAVFLILACLPAWGVGPTVANVQAHQWQDGTGKVQITYYLTDPDSARVLVSVAISADGGSTYGITPTSVTGDIGWVRTGGTRTIVWDAKAQYPDAVWPNCKARVTADDSSGGVYPGQMVYIPAGSFLMGNNGHEPYSRSEELPQYSVYLSGYWIGKYEVTRGEYRKFMDAGGYSNPAYWSSDGWYYRNYYGCTQPRCWAAQQDWETGTFTQTDNHPVVGVSWYEAEAYCSWAGVRLTTEAEWEKAARWVAATSHPNVYPWGDDGAVEKCNNRWDTNPAGGGYEKYQTAAVGSYPAGASPYGCQDMAGNAWEWVQDWFKSYPGSGNPFDLTGSYRVLRGGYWYYFQYYPYYFYSYRCAMRQVHNPGDNSNINVGFRVAR